MMIKAVIVTGKVEMFDLNGNFIKTIYSNQPGAGDLFGRSCAIGSTFMLIGSYNDDDKGTDAGKVEMFDLDGNYIKTIYSNQPAASDYFGCSCVIGSTFMLIGSFGDDDKGVHCCCLRCCSASVRMFRWSAWMVSSVCSIRFSAACSVVSLVQRCSKCSRVFI